MITNASLAASMARNASGELFGHPRGLTVLCLTGMWEVFALFGMRTVLVYYLARQLHYSEAAAIQIYALSSAASVILSLVGGAFADRLCGLRRAVLIGALLLGLGQFMLVAEPLLYAGLFLIAAGDGLMKPPLIGQIGLLYADTDPRRDRAFTHFKVGCNIGALLAPILCGIAGQAWGWNWAFVVSGAGMILSAAIYVLGRSALPPDPPRMPILDARDPAGVSVLRSHVAILTFAWIGAAFFWTAYSQLGGTVALWIDGSVDRTLQMGSFRFEVPSAWFQSVNPLLVFVLAPLVTWRWRTHDARASAAIDIRKMTLGAVFLAISFAVLALADRLSAPGITSWMWLVVALVPLTLGELYLEPIGQALFTRLAPRHLVSIFVALWMLTTMAGFVASGWLGNLWDELTPAGYFGAVTALTLTGAAILWLSRRFGNFEVLR